MSGGTHHRGKARGKTIDSNLAFACAFCNRAKGTDIATLIPGTTVLVRLFNPRTDEWSDHFRLNGVRIEGISDIGKGTVALLNLNRDDRLEERAALADIGRYPPAAAGDRVRPRRRAEDN